MDLCEVYDMCYVGMLICDMLVCGMWYVICWCWYVGMLIGIENVRIFVNFLGNFIDELKN